MSTRARVDEKEMFCTDCCWEGSVQELVDAAYEPGNKVYCPECGSAEVYDEHGYAPGEE